MLIQASNGYLTLPPTLVADLGFPVVGDGEATLADGSESAFDVYGVAVVLDADGRNVGFEIDLCKAVAAVIFADPDKLEVHSSPCAAVGDRSLFSQEFWYRLIAFFGVSILMPI